MDLKVIRKNNELTQQALADQVGVKRQTISAIERGSRPSPQVAKKIAEILGFEWTKFFD